MCVCVYFLESAQSDIPIKSYDSFKSTYLENPDLESVLLTDLTSDVSLQFQRF
jgi:hypothetical protein